MKRRINFTGRKRIPHANVQLVLEEQGDLPPRFSGSVDLSGLGLPDDARVYVEAYHKESTQRFDCGKVGAFRFPKNTTLTDIDDSGAYNFRVKVLADSDGEARLAASADKIQAREPGTPNSEHEELLKVGRRQNTEGIPWIVELPDFDNGLPLLLFNSSIPGATEKMRHDPVFRGLVLPAAIRQVLAKLMVDESLTDPEPGSWQERWLRWSDRFADGPPPSPEEAEEQEEWIDGVVSGFSKEAQLCLHIAKSGENTSDD